MMLEKGLSYNFTVERIAEAKHNHYYVIKVEDKECWVKMQPFEIYQNPSKNIIRCEYRGTDSYGSHIFVEDKLSILYELYTINNIYTFYYIKDGIDMSGNKCAVLSDNYGLTHFLYEELSLEQKKENTPITCQIISIEKIQKILVLKLYPISKQSPLWIDAESLFRDINKEEFIKEYFYNALYGIEDKKTITQWHNIDLLIKQHDNKWIRSYICFLDRKLKYNVIQQGNLAKLYEFSQLMICLINWTKSNYRSWKKIPKLTKYEGLAKAVLLLQNDRVQGFLNEFIQTINVEGIMGEARKEGNVILGFMEIDSFLFKSRTVQYIRIGELFHKNESVIYHKYIEAFIGILSHRLKIEMLKLKQEVIEEHTASSQIDSSILLNILAALGMLIIFLKGKVNYEKLFQYYKIAFHRLKCMFLSVQKKETNQYIYSLLEMMDSDDSFTWNDIKKIHLATISEENQKYCPEQEDNMVEIEDKALDEQPIFPLKMTNDKVLAYWNLYKDGSYVISETPCSQEELLKSVALLESCKNGFLLLCYDKGNVNKILIRTLLEKKKRDFKYINGYHQHTRLKEVYTIKSECFILILSLYQKERYMKLYSTENISQHTSLSLKGNQVVDSIVDETDFYLIPNENKGMIPQRIVYSSPTPLGKNIANAYYEKDIIALRRMGVQNMKKYYIEMTERL